MFIYSEVTLSFILQRKLQVLNYILAEVIQEQL